MSKPEDERTKEELLRALEDIKEENRKLNDTIHLLRVELKELTDHKSKSKITTLKLFVAIRENLDVSKQILESSSINQGDNNDGWESLLLFMINRALKNIPPDIQ